MSCRLLLGNLTKSMNITIAFTVYRLLNCSKFESYNSDYDIQQFIWVTPTESQKN